MFIIGKYDLNIILLFRHENRFHGVVVSTPDFESGDLGSNPGGTSFFFCPLFSACAS
jgi:hypothetical protein